jgi:hypothetical protein
VRGAVAAYLTVAGRPSHAQALPANRRFDGRRPAAGP